MGGNDIPCYNMGLFPLILSPGSCPRNWKLSLPRSFAVSDCWRLLIRNWLQIYGNSPEFLELTDPQPVEELNGAEDIEAATATTGNSGKRSPRRTPSSSAAAAKPRNPFPRFRASRCRWDGPSEWESPMPICNRLKLAAA